ncbi:hypothetical protein V1520DRAFT_347539 [Lipomyces starkeyi]|uniref:Uncharacterized protein n=1 Tax=Lipomyces starkeyi NRRL Y-11557 TaxID=675824 RepID=A0A1E3PUR1_LIPST|nr:hypothetical protein LIPSTDRAFT_7249 [Lipomyces starkeyi NRRL Y-11557]
MTGDRDEITIFTPIGMLGYGFPLDQFYETLETKHPDVIICDAGSTDSGPQKLALGLTTCTRDAYERDWLHLVQAASLYKVPVIVSSAGGDGTGEHVQLFVDIIEEFAKEYAYSLKIVTIYSDIGKNEVRKSLRAGGVSGCGKGVVTLTKQTLDSTTRVVAQMSHEPFLQAMRENPDFDIIVAGRSYDPAPYAAYCIYHFGDSNIGLAYHLGKIMECGALCAEPKSSSALAIARRDSFDLMPVSKDSRCTVSSVIAHTLYEKSRPDILLGPGGALDLRDSEYEALEDGRTVRVKNSKFLPNLSQDGRYAFTLKLEGARPMGYRSIFVGGVRDSILISGLDQFLQNIKGLLECMHGNKDDPYQIYFHQYGRNGVMGPLEPSEIMPVEVGIICEVMASTQERATSICSTARIACVHGPYPGQVATAGNLAMPFSPLVVPLSLVTEFCVYHLMTLEDGAKQELALCPIEVLQVESTMPAEKIFVRPTEKVADPWNLLAAKLLNSAEGAAQKPKAGPTILKDVAKVIRSLDVMFPDEETYYAVRALDPPVLSRDVISNLYKMKPEDVIVSMWWDKALAFKATIPRFTAAGGFGERDVQGGQQHGALLTIELPNFIKC